MKTVKEIVLDATLDNPLGLDYKRDRQMHDRLQEVIEAAIRADRLQRPSTDALEQALTEWNAAKLLDSGDEEYDAAQEMAESIEEYLNDLEES